MSRKVIERETRKKLILKAARQLFTDKGIENTSMDDIAFAAEYTRRTLYAYFKSRDEISLSILIEDLLIRWDEQKKTLTEADTGLEKIKKWAESLYSFTLRYPHSIRLQLYWDFRGIDRELISDETFAAFEKLELTLEQNIRLWLTERIDLIIIPIVSVKDYLIVITASNGRYLFGEKLHGCLAL